MATRLMTRCALFGVMLTGLACGSDDEQQDQAYLVDLSGTVTDSLTNAPVPDLPVRVLNTVTLFGPNGGDVASNLDANTLVSTTTGPDGSFQISDLDLDLVFMVIVILAGDDDEGTGTYASTVMGALDVPTAKQAIDQNNPEPLEHLEAIKMSVAPKSLIAMLEGGPLHGIDLLSEGFVYGLVLDETTMAPVDGATLVEVVLDSSEQVINTVTLDNVAYRDGPTTFAGNATAAVVGGFYAIGDPLPANGSSPRRVAARVDGTLSVAEPGRGASVPGMAYFSPVFWHAP